MNAIQKAIEQTGGQRALAERLHITQAAVSSMALGKRRPSSETALRIERATHGAVTVEELRPDLVEHWAYLRGTAKQKEAA